MQLKEIVGAVEKAAIDPAKFNLTNEELSTRRRWIDNTRQQVTLGKIGVCSRVES
jgi:syntaxin 6